MEILALIPARSGSKSIPHKNIVTFHGKPLIAHSILQAKLSNYITRTITSTDSELYASISREYGSETPFLRPVDIAADESTDLEVFLHALDWLWENERYRPEICVHLRPTYPTRGVDIIDKAVELLLSDKEYDSVRTVSPSPETPFKMWFMNVDGDLEAVVHSNLEEPHNLPRQILPQSYIQNACVDVVRTRVILNDNSMTGKNIRGLIMPDFNDIDNFSQFESALSEVSPEVIVGKRIVFDIDGVIATITPENDYSSAEPILHTIELINRLYEMGNKIILSTARGTMTGIDWSEITIAQLAKWGVKYHELHFGKQAGDYYIDDRMINLSELKKLIEKI